MLSIFFITNNPFVTNFPSLAWQRLQEHAVYSPWFSWRQSHRSISASEAAGFFQGLLPSWTSSYFDVIFDSKLCIIRSHFFALCFCMVICCRTKMTRLILKVVVYLSIFEKKREQTPLRIITLQQRNRKLGDLLNFSFFKICIWWSFNWKRRVYAVCSLAMLMGRRVGTWNIVCKDTRDFHPILSFNLAILQKNSNIDRSKKWVKLWLFNMKVNIWYIFGILSFKWGVCFMMKHSDTRWSSRKTDFKFAFIWGKEILKT